VPHFHALAKGDPLSLSYISAAESIGVSSTTFTQSAPKATEFGEITLRLGPLRRSRSSKVTELIPIEI